MPRRVYPLISTATIVGREPRHTITLSGREVEIDGRDDDELPELIDDSPVRDLTTSQRRQNRVKPARNAFADVRAGGGVPVPAADPLDDD